MKRILLIDDNEQDRLLYRRYLTKPAGRERLELHEAATGDEGLALFAALRPDCVLLDYNLRDTDGLAVLDGLRQLAPPDTLCVVMITGGGSEQLAVRALRNGALDYLVKQQFDPELLYKTVVHAVEKNEWRQYTAHYHVELQAVNQRLRESLAELTTTRRQIHDQNAQLVAANQQIEARNQELATANHRLARTNADLDNFVYAASHDLRQPVNNLRGLFEELRRTATLQDPEEEAVWGFVDASLAALSTTITDLAAVVQQQRLPGPQAAEAVDLADLTADIRQTLHLQVVEQQATICADFAALPAVHYVRANLRTILLNLISNALKYRHPARPPRVSVRGGQEAGRPVLAVTDNGLGLDLARHGAELFQLFRRFHPQAGEGTGVGLFLVNRLVQAQGGRIEVESQPGEGTTFRVFLAG